MKAGIITFPGSNCDKDIGEILQKQFHLDTNYIWHRESFALDYDLLVLPGGFSYGDYLRSGAIARFSNAMRSLQNHVNSGRKVLGICNGFQILTESHLLPGALVRNTNMKYICKTVNLTVDANHPLSQKLHSTSLAIPIAHSEGRYHADEDTLKQLRDECRVLFRYQENPNGSIDDIAGITSQDHKVLGMMPHPERAADTISKNMTGKAIIKAFIES
ncbi:MAG: phosphoribosylformylglycinamidine synthase subunit PurQ [Spirochaetota bacterium]